MATVHTLFRSLAAGMMLAGLATAQGSQGPDITTIRIGGTGSDFAYYGQSGGIAAYSMGTTSCNPGTQVVQWTNADHPVIGQNFYRLKDGRFEHIGQSWLKHGFCAVNESGCGSCQSTSCDTLGLGCADTYGSGLNDGAGGGPKYLVNALTGVHSHPYPSPSGPSTLRGRLQVAVADIDPPQNPGAEYFAEAQYVSAHVAGAGNAKHSYSWRKLNVISTGNVDGSGPARTDQSAPYAWRNEDAGVTVVDITNNNEGGNGVHGHFTAAYRVTDLGGTWRYNYVVENLTSEQSGASFSVPVPDGTVITNVFFNDVDYHSGEPFNGTDWITSHSGGVFSWTCPQTHQQNPNANALRWGTMYSFGFDADGAPLSTVGEIGLFAPGTGSVLTFATEAPAGGPSAGSAYCFGDASGTFCPCLNFGLPGHGCENSAFSDGARLSGTGDPSVSGDTLVFNATQAIPNQPGLFFQGDEVINSGNGVTFGDGLRCAGQNVLRLEIATAGPGGSASTSVAIGAAGGAAVGETLRYQYWYRDPSGSPCGTGFNTTNGLEVVWQP